MSYDKFTEFPALDKTTTWGDAVDQSKIFWDNLLERVRVFEADVEDWGAVGDGVTDDHAIIQALIDNPLYSSIRIGHTSDKTFFITQPLRFVSDKKYYIGGTITIKDATIVSLSQNVTAGDTIIYLTSVTGFNVGEQICITSDTLPLSGGGTGQTKRFSSSGQIKSVGSNYIEMVLGSLYDVLVADNGRVGHTQSLIVCDNADNIEIYVSGVLDDNGTNQLDAEPVKFGGGEDTHHGCCLTFWQCHHVKVHVNEARNGQLHNVSFSGNATKKCYDITYSGYCHAAHDKNTLVAYTDKMNITDYEGNDALFEDGIIFYVWCTNIFFSNIRVSNNNRYGVSFGNYCSVLVGRNIYTSGNTSAGINWIGKDINVSDIYSTDIGRISLAYPCENINISNWTFKSATGTYILWFRGAVKRVNISNLIFDDCDGVAIRADKDYPLAGNDPCTDINIIGGGIFNHKGATNELAVGTDIVFTAFRNL